MILKWDMSWKDRKSLRRMIYAIEGLLRTMHKYHIYKVPWPVGSGEEVTYLELEDILNNFKAQLALAKGVELNDNYTENESGC